MSTPRLLPGPSSQDDIRREFEQGETAGRLQQEVTNLRRQIKELDEEVRERDRRIAKLEKGVDTLQHALAPTFRGMQMIFGVFEDLGINGVAFAEDTYSQTAAPKVDASFWDGQKRRFPGKPSEVIDVLMERPMTVMHIVTAARMDRKTVYNCIDKLKKAGLVEKNGGMFSLKQH